MNSIAITQRLEFHHRSRELNCTIQLYGLICAFPDTRLEIQQVKS